MRGALLLLALALLPASVVEPAEAARAKDIGRFFGVREVQVSGYGIVTGLQLTGDTMINRGTVQLLVSRLAAQGMVLDAQDIMSRNAALVNVTAKVRSDGRLGARVDVHVSSAGDARSLEGGVLQPTLLFSLSDLSAPYVVAQGPLTVGGYNVETDGNLMRRNVANVGVISGGGILEREFDLGIRYDQLDVIDFLLNEDHEDFTTAARIADAINADFQDEIAQPVSASTVRIQIPQDFRGRFARFAARIEQVDVAPDAIARVVVDARTGTVVLGGAVTVRPFAIAHGGLKVEVQVERGASQPGAFATGGQTVVVENTFIGVNEEKGELVLVNATTLADLVSALNAMGVTPRDLVVVLQAIYRAGAIDAELVVR
jgi:flagellar P-ring protein precursor FlgI